MNEQIFPPSPNWYLSSAFSCNSSGALAYGNRNNLVVVKTDIDDPRKSLPKVEIIPNAHKERVTVVVFSPDSVENKSLKNCIATAGDDTIVKVWDMQSMAPLLAHVSHGNDTKLCCMDWSIANPDLIVSMDDGNNIVCWDLASNSTHTLSCGKLSPTVLSCCPVNKDLIALGCRSGLVCVINIQGRGKIMYKMRGHDSEVVSLAWCPVNCNIFDHMKNKNEKKDEDNKELLLASAAKERNIYLWRANTDGRYEIVLSIPTYLMSDKRSNKGSGDMNWVSLCWPTPNNLVCSTRLGRIISWDLKASYNSKSMKSVGAGDSSVRTWKPVHSSHSRIVFGLVCSHSCNWSSKSLESSDWRQTGLCGSEKPVVVWSSSQDRLIVGYDLNSNKEIANIPTIGGIVYCIAASPIDPNRIAFGVSDAVIRVWNLSSSSPFDVTLLWQKVRGKVTSIAWHPTQENRLAFGTAEGRVGVFDSLNSNKPPILFRPYHTKCLYVVIWGPALFGAGEGDGNVETKYALYSCGEGNVVQYDIHNPEAEPKNINDLQYLSLASRKSLIRTDLAWKPDNSILALGNEDGSVQLISPTKNTLLHTIHAHKNLVQSLAWHPEGTATDTGYSPCQHWLAVASKKSPIKVYNLSLLLEGDATDDVECIAVFSQHKQCVVGMVWSPHISGQLVSVSFDETAQVWDVLRQQPVGNYHYHEGVLHSCCWSPVDPDLVLTGSADSTLRVWRISTLDRTLPVDKKKERNALKKGHSVQYSTKNSLANSSEKDQPPDENINSAMMPSCGIATRESDSQQGKSGRQKSRSFFPVWAHMWQGSVGNILDRLQLYLNAGGIPDTEANLLGNRSNVLKLLELEETQHLQNGNLESMHQMALWKGDIGEMIRDVAKKKKLTDWHISLAPMVSQRLWMDTCHMYAEQLVTEGRIHKAATYLLACHKVEEAIQLFLQHHLYREALALAKLRLSSEDPLTISIAHTWSQQLITEGHYERAAECLLSIGDLNGAAEILGRRNDTRCLWMATEIASKANADTMSKCFAKNCILQCLLHKTWDLASKVTSQYSELQPLTVIIFSHKTVCELLTGKIVIDDPLPKWLKQKYEAEYHKNPEELYESLERFMEKNVPDTKSRLWLAVSGELAQSSCSSDPAVELQHLVRAANLCYQYQLMHPSVFPLLQYLRWLAPKDLITKQRLFSEESSDETVAPLLRSLRFYFYAGYLSWLQSELQSTQSTVDPTLDNDEEVVVNETKNHLPNGKETKISQEEACSFSTTSSNQKEQSENECTLDDPNIPKTDNIQKFNWKDIMIPLLTEYSEELDLEAASLTYYKLQVEIKRWEQEVAGLVALKHQSLAESAKTDSTSDQEKDENTLLKGLQKLDELKEQKESFEGQRGSAPNPFVTYCHFRSICDHLIKEKFMDNLKPVLDTANQRWLSMTAGI